MEDGQLNNMKVGAVIQARMHSTRLPGKILLPLPFANGSPLLVWPINQLKKSKAIHSIVLATSRNEENKLLKKVAEENGIAFYAGSEEDVLSRFVETANNHNLDVLIRVTGDNPIIDEALIDELLDVHINGGYDYSFSNNLPLGMNIEIVKATALQEVFERTDLIDADREHVTYFFKRTSLYKVYEHNFNLNTNRTYRLTVDYPADYAMLNIVSQLSLQNNLFGLPLINYVAANYSWVFDINAHLYQKKPYSSLNEELLDALKMLQMHEFSLTKNYLETQLNR